MCTLTYKTTEIKKLINQQNRGKPSRWHGSAILCIMFKIIALFIIKLFAWLHVKVRISNSRLFIEQGRYKQIPVGNRICPLCSLDIEDEIYFFIVCPKLDSPRQKLFEKHYKCCTFFLRFVWNWEFQFYL